MYVVTLECWSIVRVSGHGMRLAGDEDGRYPRISSPLVEPDPVAMTAVTVSGRHYLLRGDPNPSYAVTLPSRFRQMAGTTVASVSLDEAVADLRLIDPDELPPMDNRF